MGSAGNVRAGGAYVEISAEDKSLQAALARAGARFKAFGSVVSGIGLKIGAAGAAITAPLLAAAKTSVASGAALYDMARRTGISAASLSSLGFAAGVAGTDIETLEGALRRMQKTVAGVEDAAEGTTGSLAHLGINAAEIKSLAPDEQFRRIAAAIGNIKDPTERAAAAMKVFGRTGTTIIPMIDQLAELEATAKRFGLVKSDESARSAKELSVAFFLVERAMKSVWGTLSSAILPALKEQTTLVLRGAIAVRDWIKDHKELVATAFKVGLALSAAGVAFIVVGKAIGIVGAIIGGVSTAFTIVSGAVSGLATLLSASLFGAVGLTITALVGLGAYLIYVSGVGQTMLQALGGYFGDLKDTALETFGGIRDALSAGDWALAAGVAWAGLKLAWAQGIQPLMTMWAGLKNFALQTFATIGDGIVEYTIRAISGLRNAWEEFRAWFKNLTTDIGDKAVGLLIDAKESRGDITHEEADAQRRNLGQINKAGHDQINAERDAAIAANNTETAARLAAIKQIHDAEVARINAKSDEEIAATQADLDAKKKALDELTKKAKTEAKNAKDRFPALPGVPALGKGIDPGALDGVMGQVKTAGTFNAAAAFGLAGGNVSQKQLDEMKKANKMAAAILAAQERTGKALEGLLSLS